MRGIVVNDGVNFTDDIPMDIIPLCNIVNMMCAEGLNGQIAQTALESLANHP